VHSSLLHTERLGRKFNIRDVMRNEIVTYTPGGNGAYTEKPAGKRRPYN
jgi:hypothetical protein